MDQDFFKVIEDISKNYDLYVANGSSIHEYSHYKSLALNYAHLATKYGDKEHKDKAKQSIYNFAKFVGERILTGE